MANHQLRREQTIARPLANVFEFFADAGNLETLTPPWLHFEILTPPPIAMRQGAIIQYALRIHGIRCYWTTAIAQWNPPHEFVDVQLLGPYRLWHHRHTFASLGSATRMIDEIHYRLPYGWVGELAGKLFVKRDLQAIFDYRERTITRLLAADPPAG